MEPRIDSIALGMLSAAPLDTLEWAWVILSIRSRMSASLLVEESLERQSPEFLSCLTYVLFKERPEDLRDSGRLWGQEAFERCDQSISAFTPPQWSRGLHESPLTRTNTGGSKASASGHGPGPSASRLIRRTISLCSLIQANT